MKRKTSAEWGSTDLLSTLEDIPKGTEVQTHSLNNDQTLVHVILDGACMEEHADRLSRSMKDVLPPHMICVVTTNQVKINVRRPPTSRTDIDFNDCIIDKKAAEQFREIVYKLQQGGHLATITFNRCHIENLEKDNG
jgi:hypothetical protein